MTTFDGSPLGKATDYPDRYDALLLFAVPRAPQRAALGIEGNLPFSRHEHIRVALQIDLPTGELRTAKITPGKWSMALRSL